MSLVATQVNRDKERSLIPRLPTLVSLINFFIFETHLPVRPPEVKSVTTRLSVYSYAPGPDTLFVHTQTYIM